MRAKKPRKPSPRKTAAVPDNRSMVQRTLSIVQDAQSPHKLRIATAIGLLKSGRVEVVPALRALADHPKTTRRQLARIGRALVRHDSRVEKRDGPKEQEIDLTGPCTMAILLDDDLYRQWRELHFDDPGEVFGRHMLKTVFLTRIPTQLLDELRHIPDLAERTRMLDELAVQYPRMPVSDEMPPPPAEYSDDN